MERLANATNVYGWMNICSFPSYDDGLGSWIETDAAEMQKLIGQMLYMSIVQMPQVNDYY